MIDTNSNFWKSYPELKFVPGLGDLYDQDKSKNKLKSSKIMWAIYMCEMPDSKLYNRPDKYDEVETRFMKGEGFKWVNNQHLIESFRASSLSDAERALTDWNDLMNLRRTNLRRLYTELIVDKDVEDIDTKSLKELDAMLAATPKLFDDYKKVKADFGEELIHKKGTKVKSASDNDEL
jgi:hypothetical protein